jgi:hypothetical protein
MIVGSDAADAQLGLGIDRARHLDRNLLRLSPDSNLSALSARAREECRPGSGS